MPVPKRNHCLLNRTLINGNGNWSAESTASHRNSIYAPARDSADSDNESKWLWLRADEWRRCGLICVLLEFMFADSHTSARRRRQHGQSEGRIIARHETRRWLISYTKHRVTEHRILIILMRLRISEKFLEPLDLARTSSLCNENCNLWEEELWLADATSLMTKSLFAAQRTVLDMH